MKIIIPKVFLSSLGVSLLILNCGKSDVMNVPYEVEPINAGTNSMLQKIDDIGDVNWHSIDFKKMNV